MNSRLLKILAAVIAVLAVAAFFLYPRSIPAQPLPPATDRARAAASAANAFGFDLFDKLRSRPGNLCFSPCSIHTALAMTHEGAAGLTAAQLAATLHLDATARLGQRDLHSRLQAPGNHGFELSLANRLWLHHTLTVPPALHQCLVNDFHADAQSIDFNSPKTLASINAWIGRQTQAHISEALSAADLTPQTVAILTNALYFKGHWDVPFKKADTADGDFYLDAGAKVRVPLMHQTQKHAFADIASTGTTPAFRALSLDYTGGDLALLLLLPDLGQLDQLEAALNDILITAVLRDLHQTLVPVTLPRFILKDSVPLLPALQSLGITDAFDLSKANFTNLAPSVYINAIVHKTFIDVNEQGTEAAATTSAVFAGAIEAKPAEFKADHPFLFLLRDKSSGAILFLGRLNSP